MQFLFSMQASASAEHQLDHVLVSFMSSSIETEKERPEASLRIDESFTIDKAIACHKWCKLSETPTGTIFGRCHFIPTTLSSTT